MISSHEIDYGGVKWLVSYYYVKLAPVRDKISEDLIEKLLYVAFGASKLVLIWPNLIVSALPLSDSLVATDNSTKQIPASPVGHHPPHP